MRPTLPQREDERGIALIMAIVSMLIIGAIALVLMVNLNVERKISGNDLRDAQALNLAEAGVGEAMSRIRNFDIALNTANPRSVAQIFLANAGSVPVLGVDSVAVETRQPVGQWLTYSTASKNKDALTVEFKTNSARTEIYRYDTAMNPPIQTTSGLPIYHITSTGRKGTSRVRVQTDIIQKPFPINIPAAFTGGVEIEFSGNSDVCGYNHTAATPIGTKGRPPCDGYETGFGNLPGAWSTGPIGTTGSSIQNGTPPRSSGNAGQFYQGPWEMVGMGSSEFFTWIGNPAAAEPNPPTGLIHLDNNATYSDQSGDYAYHGGNGEGLLYVDGDLTINGTFNYRGVIYVEGDLKINGTVWILGALIARGKTKIKIANGNLTVLYSGEQIQMSLAKYGGQFVTLSWRQIPLN